MAAIARSHIVSVHILVVLVTFVQIVSARANYTATCHDYCDYNSNFVRGYNCTSSVSPIFCCQRNGMRECCYDRRYALGAHAPVRGKEACWRSWWITHWRVLIGLLTALLFMLVLGALCYCCCDNRDHRHRMRVRGQVGPIRMRRPQVISPRFENSRRSMATHVRPQRDRISREHQIPEHEPRDVDRSLVLTPPPYNSLSKDPPTYQDVYNTPAETYVNPGFVEAEQELPPPYTPAVTDSTNQNAAAAGRMTLGPRHHTMTSQTTSQSESSPSYASNATTAIATISTTPIATTGALPIRSHAHEGRQN